MGLQTLTNHKGFSLVQTLLGVAIGAITMSAIVAVTSKTVGEVKDADLQALMDSEHANSLHRVSSLQNVIEHFSLQDSGTSSALSLCLKGRGTNCTVHQAAPQTYIDSEGELNGLTGPNGRCQQLSFNCNIEKSAVYSWVCPTATECTKLKITVRTVFRGTSTNKFLHPRVNDFELSTRALLSRGQIDFSCANSGLLIGVNYKSLRGICAQLTGTSNTTNFLPARTVGPAMEHNPGSRTCTNGFTSLGLFSTAATCK